MLPALSATKSQSEQLDNSHKDTSKRASSMIFRIEHLLPSAMPSPHAIDPATKRPKLIRNGLYTAQFTPKDTVSSSIDTLSLIADHQQHQHQHQHRTHIDAEQEANSDEQRRVALSQGLLQLSPSMMRRIKLSEDIHGYNALFELHDRGVRVRIVRDVRRDEEILAWFSEEITLLMSIPFLTPLNIQGNSSYTCHLCQLTFETPNPLKVHLALSCGRHSIDILWLRLHYALKAAHHSNRMALRVAPVQSTQPLTPPTTFPGTLASASASTPAKPQNTQPSQPPQPQHPQHPQHIQQQQHRFSAFKPIAASHGVTTSSSTPEDTLSLIRVPLVYTSTTTSATCTTASTSLSFMPSISSAVIAPIGLMQSATTSPLNAAAQIEAIVSNMGASKQGHLCIYCGKVYSRKYGLKIHIRTHTGFKPLKCKYCLRPFGDPSNLNKHVRLHLQSSNSAGGSSSATGSSAAGYDGYKCHLCHKMLARRRDLHRHMESRHSHSRLTTAPTRASTAATNQIAITTASSIQQARTPDPSAPQPKRPL